jgi:hypothetical protein
VAKKQEPARTFNERLEIDSAADASTYLPKLSLAAGNAGFARRHHPI